MKHKFLFFGTPSVAERTLAHLLAAGYTPCAVVTNADAPKGRGMALTPSPVKVLAEKERLPVLTPETIDESAIADIRAYGADYAIVVAYGKIFPEALIAAFPKGVLNVHYSLLPKYRGATPVEAALLNGDTVTGVTVQKMVRELDAGDMLIQREVAIDPHETIRELRPRLIEAGAEALISALPQFESGEAVFVAQDASKATRSGKFKKDDGELDLSDSDSANWNRYRAFADSIGTFFYADRNGKRIRVKISSASLGPGGRFTLEKVIPEGKKEMPYETFLRSESA